MSYPKTKAATLQYIASQDKHSIRAKTLNMLETRLLMDGYLTYNQKDKTLTLTDKGVQVADNTAIDDAYYQIREHEWNVRPEYEQDNPSRITVSFSHRNVLLARILLDNSLGERYAFFTVMETSISEEYRTAVNLDKGLSDTMLDNWNELVSNAAEDLDMGLNMFD